MTEGGTSTRSVTIGSGPSTWDFTYAGLRILDPNLPYGDFEHLCSVLGALHKAVRFAIGDAILQGEELYGERAYQAFEHFQLSEEAMREYVRVALRVPRSHRRAELSWSHHRAVAALPPAQQKEWLEVSVEEGLSHHALREALRNGDGPEAREYCRCCGRAL